MHSLSADRTAGSEFNRLATVLGVDTKTKESAIGYYSQILELQEAEGVSAQNTSLARGINAASAIYLAAKTNSEPLVAEQAQTAPTNLGLGTVIKALFGDHNK